MTERLINYQNSWQFIFHQSINRSLVAALFVTVRKQAGISIDCCKINSKLYNIVCIVTCVHTGSLQFCIASCLSVLTGTAESNRAIVNVTSYACSLSVVWWNEHIYLDIKISISLSHLSIHIVLFNPLQFILMIHLLVVLHFALLNTKIWIIFIHFF